MSNMEAHQIFEQLDFSDETECLELHEMGLLYDESEP